MSFTEKDYEKVIIQLFEEMEYTHVCGYDIDRDYNIPLYMDELTAIVANHWTFVENEEKRPDVLLFINDLPVVLMEYFSI